MPYTYFENLPLRKEGEASTITAERSVRASASLYVSVRINLPLMRKRRERTISAERGACVCAYACVCLRMCEFPNAKSARPPSAPRLSNFNPNPTKRKPPTPCV